MGIIVTDSLYNAVKNIMIDNRNNAYFNPSDLIGRRSNEPGVFDFLGKISDMYNFGRKPDNYDLFSMQKPLHERIKMIPTDSTADNEFEDFGFSFNTEMYPLHERFYYTMENMNGIKKTFFDTQMDIKISNMLYEYAKDKNNICRMNMKQNYLSNQTTCKHLDINGYVKNRFSNRRINPNLFIISFSDILTFSRLEKIDTKSIKTGCVNFFEMGSNLFLKKTPLCHSSGIPEGYALLIDTKYIDFDYLNKSLLMSCDLKLNFHFMVSLKMDVVKSNAVHIFKLIYD